MKESGRRRLSREERIAFHEAGHFVAGLHTEGAPTARRVTIVPDAKGEALGRVDDWRRPSLNIETFESGRDRLRCEAHIVCLLAGDVAEKRAAGRSSHVGARHDVESANNVAFSVVGGDEREARAYLRWLNIRTQNLIAFAWPDVEAAARALLERKTLSGKELRDIVLRSSALEGGRAHGGG